MLGGPGGGEAAAGLGPGWERGAATAGTDPLAVCHLELEAGL